MCFLYLSYLQGLIWRLGWNRGRGAGFTYFRGEGVENLVQYAPFIYYLQRAIGSSAKIQNIFAYLDSEIAIDQILKTEKFKNSLYKTE